jgi:hypothetical protein
MMLPADVAPHGGMMSTRKTTLFYGLLIAISSLAVGMVIASRLDLAPQSSAQTLVARR